MFSLTRIDDLPRPVCGGYLGRGACFGPRLHRWAGLGVLLAALFTVQPSLAQKLHPREPLMMDPHSTIYVNDGSCSAGKVLKVQWAARNQRRKKSCVPLSDLQGFPRTQSSW